MPKGALGAVAAGLFCYLAADLAGLGLALDGLVYANVAKLLASGEGGFWVLPHYIDDRTLFADQPPLGIWLLSLWFRVVSALTDSWLWAEKGYSVALALIGAALTCHFHKVAGGRASAALPIALLALMPTVSYTLKNNFLENLLTLLTLAACLSAWRAPRSWLWTALTALAVALAVYVKGPVGLFPLIAPWLFGWLVAGDFKAGLRSSLVASGLTALALAAVMRHPPARAAAEAYWQSQLGPSLAGERSPDHGRLYQLGQLALNLGVAGLAALVLGGWRDWRWNAAWRRAGAVAAVALCAALPLLLSPRQYRHYLLPALPLFAVAISLLAPRRLPRLPYRALAIVLAFAGGMRFAYNWQSVPENEPQILEALRLAEVVPGGTITVCANAKRPETLMAYLFRHHGLRTAVAANPGPDVAVVCAVKPTDRHQPALDLHGGFRLWRPIEGTPERQGRRRS